MPVNIVSRLITSTEKGEEKCDALRDVVPNRAYHHKYSTFIKKQLTSREKGLY